GPAAGDRLTPELAALAQAVAPDSLRRAVAEVFARPEYRWVSGRSPLQWLFELVGRVLDWLGRTQENHPGAFKLLLAVLSLAPVAVLGPVAYLVWLVTRPHAP